MSCASNLLNIARSFRGSMPNPLDNPREVGHFSMDADREIHFDRSQMKYYVPRSEGNVSLDLNVGYEDLATKHYESGQGMRNLLKWIEYKDFDPLKRYEVDFVCCRGTIQDLMCTVGKAKSWIIYACRMNDTIYLQNATTDSRIEYLRNQTDEQKRVGSYGYKFQQYVTASEPDGVPDLSSNTHWIDEFCIVVANRLGSHSILMRAEIDGVDTLAADRPTPGSGSTSCYVEMKTARYRENFRGSNTFKRYKSLNWWARSAPVGIQRNICALWNNYGIVKAIEEIGTNDLPQLYQELFHNFWNPDRCFKFCSDFLEHVKNTLKENDHRIVYKFEYSGESEISEERMQDPEERYRVIPDWYITSKRKREERSGENLVTQKLKNLDLIEKE